MDSIEIWRMRTSLSRYGAEPYITIQYKTVLSDARLVL